ncbi:SGNH/GDSL hydrolase family protein [Afipia sp. TerB]
MRAALCALVLAGVMAVAPVRAENAESCAVPAYLLTTEATLTKTAEMVKARQPLNILVVGTRSSSLSGPDGAAASYPARMADALRSKLPGITVNLTTDIHPKQITAEVSGDLQKLAEDRKPTLVVWQTGTVDAMRSIDPDDFRLALDEGIGALQKSGADVILMNLQYSPRTETILSASPYIDTMRVVAQEWNVPLFDRFNIMRHWSETGDFDLFGPVHGFGMAKRVHDCIGRALAKLVIEAAHINPTELGTQR